MAHNDNYLDGLVFGIDDGTVVIPFHDAESLHDEADAVKTDNLANGCVTQDKIANGAVGRDQLDPEIVESWDSINQLLAKFVLSGVDSVKFSNWGNGGRIELVRGQGSVMISFDDVYGPSVTVNGKVVWQPGI